MLHDSQDRPLIEATLRGDQGAFESLVRSYASTVKAVSLAIVRNLEDADDVAQESFVKAYSGLGSLRDSQKFGPWIAEIARNTARTWSGKSIRREHLHVEILEQPETPPDHAQSELHRAVRQSLEGLPPADREVLLLHYFAGQSTREIASLLNVKPGAIQKRLQRARERLGERLAPTLADAFDSPQGREASRRRVMAVIALAPPPKVEAISASLLLSPARLKMSGALIGLGVVLTATLVAVRTEYFGVRTARNTDTTASESSATSPATAPVIPEDDAVAPASPSATPKKTSTRNAITGRVIDVDGEGVAGAMVRAYAGGGDPPEIRADANGEFVLDSLAVPEYALRVTNDGFVPLTMPDVSRGTADLTLVLLRRSGISGRIVDAYSGAPIKGFSLSVQPWGATFQFNDEDGKFHVEDLRPYQATMVHVTASGYESMAQFIGNVPAEA